jgi:hypothetical protein
VVAGRPSVALQSWLTAPGSRSCGSINRLRCESKTQGAIVANYAATAWLTVDAKSKVPVTAGLSSAQPQAHSEPRQHPCSTKYTCPATISQQFYRTKVVHSEPLSVSQLDYCTFFASQSNHSFSPQELDTSGAATPSNNTVGDTWTPF